MSTRIRPVVAASRRNAQVLRLIAHYVALAEGKIASVDPDTANDLQVAVDAMYPTAGIALPAYPVSRLNSVAVRYGHVLQTPLSIEDLTELAALIVNHAAQAHQLPIEPVFLSAQQAA
jgi:hypothetical protein